MIIGCHISLGMCVGWPFTLPGSLEYKSMTEQQECWQAWHHRLEGTLVKGVATLSDKWVDFHDYRSTSAAYMPNRFTCIWVDMEHRWILMLTTYIHLFIYHLIYPFTQSSRQVHLFIHLSIPLFIRSPLQKFMHLFVSYSFFVYSFLQVVKLKSLSEGCGLCYFI